MAFPLVSGWADWKISGGTGLVLVSSCIGGGDGAGLRFLTAGRSLLPLSVQKQGWVRHGLSVFKTAESVKKGRVLEGLLGVKEASGLPVGWELLGLFSGPHLAGRLMEEGFLWRPVSKGLGTLPGGPVKLLLGGMQLEGEVGSRLSLLLQLRVEDGCTVAPPLQLLQELPLPVPQAGPQSSHQSLLVPELFLQLEVVLFLLLQLGLHDLAFVLQFLVDSF